MLHSATFICALFLIVSIGSMDPDRHLPIPGHKHPPAMLPPSAPDPQARPIASSTNTSQPSLPSIRQLHPFLPLSGGPQPHLPPQDPPSYGYAPPGGYAGPSGSTDFHPSQPISRGTVHHRSDSEQEGETEQPGPAKKKRRRQALSCNGTSSKHRTFLRPSFFDTVIDLRRLLVVITRHLILNMWIHRVQKAKN